MKRILIVNGDDLGYACGVNLAIMKCFKEGILRSTTLMANGSAFDHAASLVRELRLSGLCPGIGAHLVLTELKSLCDPREIGELADERGLLPRSPEILLGAILRGKVRRDAILKELDRQVVKILDHGIQPTHIDSHKHVHLLPQVLDAASEVARKYAIPWIRHPFDATPFWPTIGAIAKDKRSTFCKQHIKSRLALSLKRPFLNTISRSGLQTVDRFFGISLTGVCTEEALLGLLRRLPPGISELMAHPGDFDPGMEEMQTRLKKERQRERDLLLSPRILDFISQSGIELRSYGELSR